MNYDKRFELQKQAVIVDDLGDAHVEWPTVYAGWGAFQNLSSREYWEAAAVQQEGEVKLLCRYHPKFDSVDTRDARIVDWAGRIYDIKSIDNTKFRNEQMCVRMMATGEVVDEDAED